MESRALAALRTVRRCVIAVMDESIPASNVMP